MADHGEPRTPPTDMVTVEFRMASDHMEAEHVYLVGEFNDWSRTATPMVRSGSHFVAAVQLARGRTYRYKFLVDGTRWENDWHADAYVSNEFGGDDSLLDLTGRLDPDDPDSPGAAIDDLDGPIPEPNEPA